MNQIVGFAYINPNAKTCKGAINPDEFLGKTCAVMEFGFDDCILALNPEGTALAMFDKEDVHKKFKCNYINGIVIPPDLEFIEQMIYINKIQQRKGGYNNLIRNMVIEASLLKGKFYDHFLMTKKRLV